MKKLPRLVLGETALVGVPMTEAAQAEPDYPFAATEFVGGGSMWLELGGGRCLD